MYTVKQEYHNKKIPGDAKSGDVFSIVTTWSDLHNNVRADQDTPRPITRAQCDTNPESVQAPQTAGAPASALAV